MGRYEGTVTADSGANIAANAGYGPMRLDVYAASVLKILTRSQIKSRNLAATVNGKAAKLSSPVKAGDRIALSWDERPPPELPPENIPLSVIYEDDTCVVLDKAQGMVVHPGAGNYRGTLVNALLWRQMGKQQAAGKQQPTDTGHFPIDDVCADVGHPFTARPFIARPFIVRPLIVRPFIVHRLDKDTSGVLIAAYTEDALRFLSGQFKERAVKKTYAAIVAGVPPQERGLIDTGICRDTRNRKTFMASEISGKGKRAVTRYKLVRSVVSGGGTYSLLLLKPRTGRTHQLRVHLRHIGCPILGDPLYSKKDPRFPAATLMLHALSLEITLPCGERRMFKSPLPGRFSAVPGLALRELKMDNGK